MSAPQLIGAAYAIAFAVALGAALWEILHPVEIPDEAEERTP